ncbi:aldehyde dehydrogenase family protein [Streptomyces coeruleorubidus]|uniref:aldehyde dehydrogenase family protein n=1 Tax=Streptomyces coeruleorubidus TaxID=116188 RepID=UPI0033F90201
MRPVSGGAADGLYGGVVEVEQVDLSAQVHPFLVGCLQADDRCGCDRAGLQGLGGKSPTIVAKGHVRDQAVADIVFGKLLSGGQTCIAPQLRPGA